MLLYILLIIIAIGVLLASEAGQKLLGGLIGLGIIIIALGIIVGILILGFVVVFSYKEIFKNVFAYLVIIGATIGVTAVIIDIIKNKIEMQKLDKKIKQNKSNFEEKE